MARRRIRVRPGKAASLVSFVMGLAFVVIGLVAVIPMAGPFGLLWTAGCTAVGLALFARRDIR